MTGYALEVRLLAATESSIAQIFGTRSPHVEPVHLPPTSAAIQAGIDSGRNAKAAPAAAAPIPPTMNPHRQASKPIG